MRASKGLGEVVSRSNDNMADGLNVFMTHSLDPPADTGTLTRSKYNWSS